MTIPNQIEEMSSQGNLREKALAKVNSLMVEVADAQKRYAQTKEEGDTAIAAAYKVKQDKLNELRVQETAILDEVHQAINVVKSKRGTATTELEKITVKYNQATKRLMDMFPTNPPDKESVDVQETAQTATAS